MLALPQSQETSHLPTLSAVARLLSSERSFAARMTDVLALLRSSLAFHDARLICWLTPNDPASVRELFVTPDAWPLAWNDELATHVAARPNFVRLSVPLPALPQLDRPIQGPAELFYAGFPIRWNDQLWGVLEFRSLGAELLQPQDERLLQAILPLLASAIALESTGAQLPSVYRAGDLSKRQSQVLQNVSQQMQEPLGLNALVKQLLSWLLDFTGVEAGLVCLVDHERGEVFLQHYAGYSREPFHIDLYGESRRRWRWDRGVIGRVAQSGRSVLLRDVSQDPEYVVNSPDVRSEFVLPIVHDDQVLAVVQLDSPRSAAFGESELAFIQSLCAAAAQPLRRAIRFQELLEASTQLGQVFSSIPNGLALIDLQGRILRHNPAWLSVWGLGPIEISENFYVPWDLIPMLLKRLQKPMEFTEFCAAGQETPGELMRLELVLRDPHQELDIVSAPTRDTQGRLTGRLWVVSDVTRERQADRMKSEFVSVVSHELRTPLTSILGYTELLMARDFEPNEQREFVKTIYDESNHLSKIVEDLLGMSRIESGTVKLNQWVVSLQQLVKDVVAQINIQLTERHRLLLDVPNDLPPVYVDRDKVKQILSNLLTNATKYSPNGGEVVLSIKELSNLPEEHPAGRFVCISVRDQGIGIAPEDLPKIWERFFRVDNTNTRRIGGTGLGLSITRALVELHGGRIWVESELNRGTVFYCTLPIATELVRH
jgi:signal transduction histidine kinase